MTKGDKESISRGKRGVYKAECIQVSFCRFFKAKSSQMTSLCQSKNRAASHRPRVENIQPKKPQPKHKKTPTKTQKQAPLKQIGDMQFNKEDRLLQLLLDCCRHTHTQSMQRISDKHINMQTNSEPSAGRH